MIAAVEETEIEARGLCEGMVLASGGRVVFACVTWGTAFVWVEAPVGERAADVCVPLDEMVGVVTWS